MTDAEATILYIIAKQANVERAALHRTTEIASAGTKKPTAQSPPISGLRGATPIAAWSAARLSVSGR